MATTTVRVHTETHVKLVALSKESGATLLDTISQATESLSRQRFAGRVAAEFSELKRDRSAWAAYVGEAYRTEVADGLG